MQRLDDVVETDAQPRPLSREAGSEPIPGYRLIEPLGSGGFGDVWKCEVPGGLFKAIKFVNGNLDDVGGDSDLPEQELEALQRVKAIRHPFILSMERVEVVRGELMIVMELADKNLQDVLSECQAAGMAGIPREALLAFLLEGAEALDLMNFQHGLQHLDIKPRNLFLVSNHLKVADFGLVNTLGQAEPGQPAQRRSGITPLYASPEILRGGISRHSDQYSLAVVYQELLTGTLPFQGKNGRQLMVQIIREEPNLAALPEADQPLVAKALAKDSEQRFASCLDFLQALVCGQDLGPAPQDTNPLVQRKTPSSLWRTPALQKSLADVYLQPRPRSSGQLPQATAGGETLPDADQDIRRTPTGNLSPVSSEAGEPLKDVTKRDDFPSLVPIAHLLSCAGGKEPLSGAGEEAASQLYPSLDKLVRELFAQGAGAQVRKCADFRYLHHASDRLEYKCLVRLPAEVILEKLERFRRQWHAQIAEQNGETFVFRIPAARSFWQRCVGRQEGLEIHVHLKPLQRTEVRLSVATVRIQPFGKGGPQVAQSLWELGPSLFESLRFYLQPDPEHRVHERVAYPQGLRIYPVFPGRQLAEGIEAKGQDISRSGIGFLVPHPLANDQVYLHLYESPQLAAFAILGRIVRMKPLADGGYEVGACFPVDTTR